MKAFFGKPRRISVQCLVLLVKWKDLGWYLSHRVSRQSLFLMIQDMTFLTEKILNASQESRPAMFYSCIWYYWRRVWRAKTPTIWWTSSDKPGISPEKDYTVLAESKMAVEKPGFACWKRGSSEKLGLSQSSSAKSIAKMLALHVNCM